MNRFLFIVGAVVCVLAVLAALTYAAAFAFVWFLIHDVHAL